MKAAAKSTSLVLVVLLGLQSVLLAETLDKGKLLLLKPLCSERINKQSSDFKSNRLAALGTFALIGIGLLPTNIGGSIDDTKLGILSVGLISIIGGALTFFSAGEAVIQNNTFWALGLDGIDREIAAYAIMKNNAAHSRNARKGSGLLLIGSGLSAALLTTIAESATQSYKERMYLGAAVNLVLGWWAFNNPGESEKEMDMIDLEIGAYL